MNAIQQYMIKKIEPCNHIRHLSKDAVQKSTSGELAKQCHLHSNIPTYYLCLHCGAPLCLQFQGIKSCLEHHYALNPTHLFCLQIEQGSIWCNACKDTIQNQLFDYGPDEKADSVLKLRRFESYINNVWKELLSKNNVKFVGSCHKGIKNLGNTCFLSVVLQSLFASIPLRLLYQRVEAKEERIFLQERVITKEMEYYYDDVISKRQAQKWNIVTNKREKAKQENKKPFTSSIKNAKFNILLKEFFRQLGKEEYIPLKILNALCQFNEKYKEKQQQDAQQLLLLILDALNQGERISFLRDLDRYKEVETILGFQKLTPIQSIFGFYLLNQIQCSSCKTINRSMNLAYSIPLALGGEREVVSLEHNAGRISIDYWQELFYPQNASCCPLLAPFFNAQRLCKANNYYECQKCRSLVAYRRYFLVSEPKILVVSFKRFNAKLQKKGGYVEFPWEFTLQGVSLDRNHPKYVLYAVIVHEGASIASGHYVCFILLDGQWLLCSDEKIQVVGSKFVQSQQPYVLLYQQQV